jgi:hypothetical protein
MNAAGALLAVSKMKKSSDAKAKKSKRKVADEEFE